MLRNRQSSERPITRQEFRSVQQFRAANQVLSASYAKKFEEQDGVFENAIDGGSTSYPLATVDQTLAGAINELKAEIDAANSGGGGGGGTGSNYFPGGW